MKKKVLLLLVLATLVAGGAFAQKVGDTVDFYGKKYDVKEMNDGRVVLQLTPTLDGTWTLGSTIFTIKGNSGVIKQLPSNEGALVKSAIDKGYFKVGTTYIRNLKYTSNSKWTGQIMGFVFYNNNPDVCTETGWYNCTLTLSADGKTIKTTGDISYTYTRQ
jgi:hypothetical protein